MANINKHINTSMGYTLLIPVHRRWISVRSRPGWFTYWVLGQLEHPGRRNRWNYDFEIRPVYMSFRPDRDIQWDPFSKQNKTTTKELNKTSVNSVIKATVVWVFKWYFRSHVFSNLLLFYMLINERRWRNLCEAMQIQSKGEWRLKR